MLKTKDNKPVMVDKTYFRFDSEYNFHVVSIRNLKRMTKKNSHLYEIEYYDYSLNKKVKEKWDKGYFNMFVYGTLRALDEHIKITLHHILKQATAITNMSRQITSLMIIEGKI